MKTLLAMFVGVYFLCLISCTSAKTTTLVYYEVGAPTKTSASQETIYDPAKSKKAYSGFDRQKLVERSKFARD